MKAIKGILRIVFHKIFNVKNTKEAENGDIIMFKKHSPYYSKKGGSVAMIIKLDNKCYLFSKSLESESFDIKEVNEKIDLNEYVIIEKYKS